MPFLKFVEIPRTLSVQDCKLGLVLKYNKAVMNYDTKNRFDQVSELQTIK